MCCYVIFVCALILPIPPVTKTAAFDLLPHSRLAPAKHQPGLCSLTYRISTQSEECQKLFDQGLGYFYSYVWTEAARSFETAIRHDPQCAIAWWGLSRALQQWPSRAGQANEALKKAYELREFASYPEKQLIMARAVEKGIAKDASPTDATARKQSAQKILDELLMLHPDDEEAWMMRGLLASNGAFFGGNSASVPFYLALAKLNPLHPGANHELLHHYEHSKRPALGWVYSEKYIESSPGIPHSWHMQCHISTRLGRWELAAERAMKSIELQRQHNLTWKVKPREDHQWSHHLETCLQILVHQGRYREAKAVFDEMKSLNFSKQDLFARYYLAVKDYAALQKLIDDSRSKDKKSNAYFAALMYLHQGNHAKAQVEIETLEQSLKSNSNDKKLQNRVWETRGVYLCQTGQSEQGLGMLKKAAVASQSNYEQHAWGHGAYFMEIWGQAALAAGNHAEAEEAFLEALAHDPGSFCGAAGLMVLCERTGKHDDAAQYRAMAEKAWQHAEVIEFNRALTQIRAVRSNPMVSSSAGR